MRDDFVGQDYEVGYAKPPMDGKFKKGVSGNPSGRPKGVPDFGSQLLRELKSTLTIHENGKRKVIKKHEGIVKQLVNKALAGNLAAARLLVPHYQQALDKAPEQQRSSPLNPGLEDLQKMDADDLTMDELLFIIRANAEKGLRAELEESIEARLRRSIRAELRKSMRTELEQSIRTELEKSIRAEVKASIRDGADARRPGNRRKSGPQANMLRATAC
jgi:hypothetical protein